MDLQTTLRAGVTTGTFIKTAHPQVIEVLGTTGLAFAVIDAEHAPFDRNTPALRPSSPDLERRRRALRVRNGASAT